MVLRAALSQQKDKTKPYPDIRPAMPTSEMAGNTQTFANIGRDEDTQEVQADVAAYYASLLSRKLPSLRAGETMCAPYSALVALPCLHLVRARSALRLCSISIEASKRAE